MVFAHPAGAPLGVPGEATLHALCAPASFLREGHSGLWRVENCYECTSNKLDFFDLVLVIVYTYDLNLPSFLSLVSAGISVPAEARKVAAVILSVRLNITRRPLLSTKI